MHGTTQQTTEMTTASASQYPGHNNRYTNYLLRCHGMIDEFPPKFSPIIFSTNLSPSLRNGQQRSKPVSGGSQAVALLGSCHTHTGPVAG
ncbi:hypothetical protein PoB_004445200 [Plakobranchus ocellatus]|uniref:Uncharacterized protein n=1 Tax=Plakobranchus ocellatus TaxID=259542 RepID=A0AAV4BET2_9GAST|nr:hypothetical protein PoB_004445200 [Plakobranchus ocellatus]